MIGIANRAISLLVKFPSSKSALATVGYTLKNSDGTTYAARSTANIINLGNGHYQTSITLANPWIGVVIWDTGEETPLYAAEDINIIPAGITVPDIEASVVLAKEATVAAIPTAPLLAVNYTAPDNAAIGTIQGLLENTAYGLGQLDSQLDAIMTAIATLGSNADIQSLLTRLSDVRAGLLDNLQYLTAAPATEITQTSILDLLTIPGYDGPIVPAPAPGEITLDSLTRGNVKDDAGKLLYTDYAQCISAAINRYSKSRPMELCADMTGTGSYDLVLPDGWQSTFSSIVSIEYPVGRNPESLLLNGQYRIYRTPDGEVIRLSDRKPSSTESVRITYTMTHTEPSIPFGDLETVSYLAASYCLLRLASVYGNTTDSTIQADSVDRQSKIDEYRRLAGKFEELYNNAMGVSGTDTAAPTMTTVAPPPSIRSGRFR